MKARNKRGTWILGGVAAALAALAALWVLVDRAADPEVAARSRPPPAEAQPPAPAGGSGSAPGDTGAAAGLAPRTVIRAWETLDESAVEPLPAYKELVEGRVLVRLGEQAQNWPVGGELEFEVPQLGQTFAGLIERVEDDAWGNRSIVGLLREPGGREHRFVVTIGARNQFANFGTSRGSFELVATDGLGWLMPTAAMDQHVDYSRPDYRIRQRPRSR